MVQRLTCMDLLNQSVELSNPINYTRKRKSRTRGDGTKSVAETIAKWKEYNVRLDSLQVGAKPARKAPAKGSKKGCMKGKGGPENSRCNYRGVRQRTWGKWVTEIREPHRGNRLWLGTFSNAIEAAKAYDEAARAMYGPCARVNFASSSSTKDTRETPIQPTVSASESTNSGISEVCEEDVKSSGCLSEIRQETCAISEVGNKITSVKEETMSEPIMEDVNKESASASCGVKNEPTGFLDHIVMGEGADVTRNEFDGLVQGEMFDVDELLAMLTPPESDQTRAGSYSGQAGQVGDCNGALLDMFCSDVHHNMPPVEKAGSGFDYELDFLKPGRQEDTHFTLDELLLDLATDLI